MGCKALENAPLLSSAETVRPGHPNTPGLSPEKQNLRVLQEAPGTGGEVLLAQRASASRPGGEVWEQSPKHGQVPERASGVQPGVVIPHEIAPLPCPAPHHTKPQPRPHLAPNFLFLHSPQSLWAACEQGDDGDMM